MMNILQRHIAEAKKKEGGFTLVELLIVIVILGILAAVVVFSVGGITDKGNTSACAASRTAVLTASEAFYASSDPSAYPADPTKLVPKFINDDATGLSITTSEIKGKGWTLTWSGGGATPPTLSACPTTP